MYKVCVKYSEGEMTIKNIGNTSKDIYDRIDDKVKDFLEIKDGVLESDLMEFAGDAFKLVGLARKTHGYITYKKFTAFLKGISEEGVPNEETINRLADYISDEEKAGYIADTFSKVLLSNSTLSCLIMGTIIKTIQKEDKPLDHEQLICISALKEFYDLDIENFTLIIEFISWERPISNAMLKSRIYQNFSLDTRRFNKFIKEKKINRHSLLLTLEKSVNSQLIGRYYESDVEVNNIDIESETADVSNSELSEFYSLTSAGLMLKELITRIKL